jgi:hypothetical protein
MNLFEHEDANAMTILPPFTVPGISVDHAYLGHCLLWMKSPLAKESLTNLPRPWTAYRWWITTTAICSN